MEVKILELLRAVGDGSVSGEEIARTIGVSRTAVWKHIHALQNAGYDIVSYPHRGYSLRESPDLLLPQEIKPLLKNRHIGRQILHFDEIASTNNEAKQRARRGARDGLVVVAEAQNAGRGRLSRGWFSPRQKGLWFSVMLRPYFPPQDAPKCTLMAAVAIVRAIRRFGPEVVIKWPNDILYRGKKLVGILTEMSAEMERINYIVIGAGVNVNIRPEDFPDDLKEIATSLAIIKGEPVPRLALFVEILTALEEVYFDVLLNGFDETLREWRKYAVTLGQEVSVVGINETFNGTAVDIDEDGALLIDTAEGYRRVLAGDVSIRPRKK